MNHKIFMNSDNVIAIINVIATLGAGLTRGGGGAGLRHGEVERLGDRALVLLGARQVDGRVGDKGARRAERIQRP